MLTLKTRHTCATWGRRLTQLCLLACHCGEIVNIVEPLAVPETTSEPGRRSTGPTGRYLPGQGRQLLGYHAVFKRTREGALAITRSSFHEEGSSSDTPPTPIHPTPPSSSSPPSSPHKNLPLIPPPSPRDWSASVYEPPITSSLPYISAATSAVRNRRMREAAATSNTSTRLWTGPSFSFYFNFLVRPGNFSLSSLSHSACPRVSLRL